MYRFIEKEEMFMKDYLNAEAVGLIKDAIINSSAHIYGVEYCVFKIEDSNTYGRYIRFSLCAPEGSGKYFGRDTWVHYANIPEFKKDLELLKLTIDLAEIADDIYEYADPGKRISHDLANVLVIDTSLEQAYVIAND